MNYELTKEEKIIFINNFINQSMNASNDYDTLKRKLEAKKLNIYWNEKYQITPIMFLLGFNKGNFNYLFKDKEQDFRDIFKVESYDVKIKSRPVFLSGNAIKKLKYTNDTFYNKDVFGNNLLHYGSSNESFRNLYLIHRENVEKDYIDKTNPSYNKKAEYLDFEKLENELNPNIKSHMFYMLMNMNPLRYSLKEFNTESLSFFRHHYLPIGVVNYGDIEKMTDEEKLAINKKCQDIRSHMKTYEKNLLDMEKMKEKNIDKMQILGGMPVLYENDTLKMLSVLNWTELKLEQLDNNKVNKSKRVKI